MKGVKFFVLVGAVLVISGCTAKGLGKLVKFSEPSIKDAFCGVHINYQYCKCAFHNEFCNAIGMKKGPANTYVQAEYKKWRDQQLALFGAECSAKGGIFKTNACQYCAEGYTVSNGQCKDEKTVAAEFKPDGPLTAECVIKQGEFDRDWKKYSDIDDAIPFEDRSYEAKQALTVYETMISKMLEAFALERDVALEKDMIAELTTYREALVKNIKTNLLKSFWRLAWVTYSTIDSTRSLKGSYEKLIDEGEVLEHIGAALKIIRSGVPPDSSFAIDTSSITGKIKSGGASVALDAVESLGDPVTVATTLFQETITQSLPTADITEEEVAILESQNLKKGVIDEILKESADANTEREAKLATLEMEIADLQKEVGGWEAKEKERVLASLEESCKDQKKKFETAQ
ncbi:MAG: hypothetical protein A3B30_01065 [Candidatus Komeilibacteria bacterium RIFCSPLOWO2_01_FULL_52_15]|uniref:Uncharacterized protein n=2 Tax=Candidatus Komeiliibacteriota TaxID=1817908 RepID=A0A1G2BR12_9BACT|nr:MAG: hypothetical protein A2677_00045 [Candidatus Komeilibacteria bacterium RIFCSPHIGHO2_01_FULL_52_14]OGY91541.1 MAG: hypothetical protein A3B30_01065 [Candidatus Komeilibacteria bacterium RIFCSPLOWO2_01_FULL_52_15]